ncbi:hypothetical protein Ga0609869_000392 [Rhodovulum iodosum]|uniref:Uncharacterized protein n=1 Tax=Rhodovulum iodosum TaxID=68291 RepID=A0ABV3XPS1_9RHOB|nr:hypothetical protein [Rhodovulum robiginosum]RSK37980.1 hypothetical protein EJA01_03375 [Rhodovulum robiginosum]
MSGLTIVLVYAGWALAPVVAYAALSHGLRRGLRGFLALFGAYGTAVLLSYAALRAEVAGQGHATVRPLAVLVPFIGAAVLSGLLYALGARIGGGE